jgi:Ohr subfamily peroxiredoxin
MPTKTLYTAHASSTGGRNGHAETSDGALKLDLASPGAPNAKPGTTNPEQLFACGYAACFGGALDYVAQQKKTAVSGVVINSSVDLKSGDDGFSIGVTLNVTVPGMAQADAEALVNAAHQVCPYSKATRGNIEVVLKVNDQELAKAA